MVPDFGMALTGIFDDSVNDIDDAEMETIDLSDEVKVEDSCVVMDNEILHAVSCRPRKFRSFKVLSLSLSLSLSLYVCAH